MKWRELLDIVGGEPVFGTPLLLAGRGGGGSDLRRQIARWRKQGKLIPLRRGVYAIASPYSKIDPHPFLLANRLKPASYVSMQSALSHYGMIPEYVPVTVSATTGRPEMLETAFGTLMYRHVKKAMFFGFKSVKITDDQTCFLATAEKALLDLLYLTPGSDDSAYVDELRLQRLETLDWNLLDRYAARADSKKVRRALHFVRDLAAQQGVGAR
jgi:predicted transcriptional regulator of viral defense system